MRPPLKQGHPNDFQTPSYALKPLLPYMPSDWVIWECASGKGNLVKGLEEHGYRVISTDILTGCDFLEYEPSERYNMILTNPPYSLKFKFLKRCYQLNKPFALLLPLTTFEGQQRQLLFQKFGVQVIFFDRRINFETPDGKSSGAWFMTAWFTWLLNLRRDFIFENLRIK